MVWLLSKLMLVFLYPLWVWTYPKYFGFNNLTWRCFAQSIWNLTGWLDITRGKLLLKLVSVRLPDFGMRASITHIMLSGLLTHFHWSISNLTKLKGNTHHYFEISSISIMLHTFRYSVVTNPFISGEGYADGFNCSLHSSSPATQWFRILVVSWWPHALHWWTLQPDCQVLQCGHKLSVRSRAPFFREFVHTLGRVVAKPTHQRVCAVATRWNTQN